MLGAVFHIKEISGENAVVSYKQKVISANICNITVTFESRTCAESKYVYRRFRRKWHPTLELQLSYHFGTVAECL